MAKDLPYFKFFVSEWNDGDITLEDYEIQGLFINICSYYWSKECQVTFNRLYKRFRGCEEKIQILLESDIIKENDEDLVISFLDEQQSERQTTSKNNSAAGKASAEVRRLKKLQQESNTILTPVELPLNGKPTIKRREEKKRKEKIKDIPNLETFMIYLKDKLTDQQYTQVRDKLILRYKSWVVNDWKDGYQNEIKNWKNKGYNAAILLLK